MTRARSRPSRTSWPRASRASRSRPTSDAVIPALDAAIAAGVQIVLMDNDLPTWTGKSSVVATDNLAGGVLAGEWLAGVLKAGDTLAILEGVPGVAALDARVDGMLQGLGDLAVRGRDRQAAADRLRPGPGPDGRPMTS